MQAKYDLDNHLAKFLIDMNVKHTKEKIDIYPRGIYANTYIITDAKLENRIKKFRNMIVPMLNLPSTPTTNSGKEFKH